MNIWQKSFIDRFYNSKLPKDQIGILQFDLLGQIKDNVIVHMPAYEGVNGHVDARDVIYEVYVDKCDMPNGIISATVLAGNLYRWNKLGYKIETESVENRSQSA